MITIKMATAGDVDIIVPLFDAYRIFYKQEPDPDAEILVLLERITRKESVIFLAFQNSEAVGFIQ